MFRFLHYIVAILYRTTSQTNYARTSPKMRISILFICKKVKKHHSLHFELSLKWLFKISGGYFTLLEEFHSRTEWGKKSLQKMHIQSERVIDHSKKTCPSIWLLKECFFTILHFESMGRGRADKRRIPLCSVKLKLMWIIVFYF